MGLHFTNILLTCQSLLNIICLFLLVEKALHHPRQ